MGVAWLCRIIRLISIGFLLFGGIPAWAQWPPGTSQFNTLSPQQETNIFLLNHYLSRPGNELDLGSLDGLKRLPDLQALVSNPTQLKNRLGLGVNTNFSDPAISRINYRWVPVFKDEETQAPAKNVLPKSLSEMESLAALIGSPAGQAIYLTQISDLETCPVDPASGSEGTGSGLPQALMIDPEISDYAVVELNPDAENPNLWVPHSNWTAVHVDDNGITAVNVKPKAPKSKPVFTPQRYKAGPVTVPVGVNYAQNWLTPGLNRTVNHSLSFQVNATNLNQSTLTYESRIPSLGKNRGTHIMALAIIQPMRQSMLSGAAIQDRLKNGSYLNTFVGYETNKNDRSGHLIVQMTHTGKPKSSTVTHTTGFIARLGSSAEATGLYQLRSGPVIASAAVTPVRFQSIQNTGQVSSSMNLGASFSNPYQANPVTGFVNVGLLKDWSKSSGITGELSAGVVFPKTRTTMYVVVPFDYFTNQEGVGPRAQFSIPLERRPASVPRR
jgi:hypothetical protein